jgi:anaerobic magnesium-protoporphyrin IX monomethyl ester cyclase
MSRILFVVPPYSSWGVELIGTWPPLQIAYMAGAAEAAGWEARIVDAMCKVGGSFDDIQAAIEQFRPDAVMAYDHLPVTGAISTGVVPAAVKALALGKAHDPRIVTLIGGPFPTFKHEELLAGGLGPVDIVVRGEPEETLTELLSVLASGGALEGVKGIAFKRDGAMVTTPLRDHVPDIDTLKAAWHLLDWPLYGYKVEPKGRMAAVLTSRGCMMGCSFCSHRAFWRADWRARDPRKVVEEFRLLVDTYKVEFITLIDPYPTKDRARWEELLDRLIEARLGVGLLMETRVEDIIRDEDILPKYKAAGMFHVYLGAEGSTEEQLVSLNKGTSVDMNKRAIDMVRKYDIVTEASFMIGHVTETPRSIDRTIEVAIRMNPDIAVFPVLTPMPFTPLYEQLKDRVRVHDYSQYNLATPIIEPYEMSLADVKAALGRCYMSFYAHKLPEVLAMPDGFKRRYMMSAMREMMRGFGQHFGGTMPHGMPGSAHAALASLAHG